MQPINGRHDEIEAPRPDCPVLLQPSTTTVYTTLIVNFIMFAARRLANIPRVRAQASLFHSTAPAFVQKGDAIPNLDVLVENSPGNKVNLAKEIKNKAVIIGTPAAFSE